MCWYQSECVLSAQMVHLDIKSSNCVLTQNMHAKIADVGIAMAASSRDGVELMQARTR